jgi:hypothetical protein
VTTMSDSGWIKAGHGVWKRRGHRERISHRHALFMEYEATLRAIEQQKIANDTEWEEAKLSISGEN